MTEPQGEQQPAMPPYLTPHRVESPDQPPLIMRWALAMAVVNAAWGALVVFAALSFVDVPMLRRQATFQGRTLTDYQVQQVISTVTTTVVVFLVVASALWVFFTVFMYKGRNWSRVTLTVLAGFWFLASIFSLTMPMYGGAAVKALVGGQLVMLIALVCLMYQSDSSDYFAGR